MSEQSGDYPYPWENPFFYVMNYPLLRYGEINLNSNIYINKTARETKLDELLVEVMFLLEAEEKGLEKIKQIIKELKEQPA